MKTIAINKKASFNFNISEKIEVGLVLTGSEVRSLRLNSASIKESYISEKKSELWLNNCHISNYEKSSQKTFEPTRNRKILVTKKEKLKIINSTNKQGYTAIPISLYFTISNTTP